MRKQLNETVQQAGIRQGLADPDSFATAEADDDDEYGAWEQQRQQEILHEQDEALDGVFRTVGNLREQADIMGRELEEQAEMLEDTENITDRVGGKLAKGMKGIKYVLEKNEGETCRIYGTMTKYLLTSMTDRWSSCCIAVLIFVLILLLILVLVI